jgi:hypothetical protein
MTRKGNAHARGPMCLVSMPEPDVIKRLTQPQDMMRTLLPPRGTTLTVDEPTKGVSICHPWHCRLGVVGKHPPKASRYVVTGLAYTSFLLRVTAGDRIGRSDWPGPMTLALRATKPANRSWQVGSSLVRQVGSPIV